MIKDVSSILHLLPKDFPNLETDPKSIDEIVCEFLKVHDVYITPVSSNIQPNPLTNAAMGVMGVGVLAANTALTQQQKGAALQEWTTWKQWSLSHPDFPAFKMEILNRYEASKEKQLHWIKSNQDRIREVLEKHEEEVERQNTQALNNQKITQKVILLFFGFCGILIIAGQAVESYKLDSPSKTNTSFVQ